MTGALMTILNIRAVSDGMFAVDDTLGALQKAGRVLGYAFVVGAGGLIGLMLGVIAALMLGLIDVC